MTALSYFNEIKDPYHKIIALTACDIPYAKCKSLSEAYRVGISERNEREVEPYKGYFLARMNEASINEMKLKK